MLVKADEDRYVLRFGLPHAIFGFHAQQATEKLLKAMIAAKGAAYAHTHDLRELFDQCKDLGEPVPALPWELRDLQEFAVLQRYDWAETLPIEERERIRQALDLLRSHVISRACAIDALDPDADVSCEPPDDATIEER